MPQLSKPNFSASEARDILKMQREAQVASTSASKAAARKYRRDPRWREAKLWVWEQRILGHSPEAIAAMSEDSFGEKLTWPRVDAMIAAANEETESKTADQLRNIENARLDYYLSKLAPRIEMGDDKAIAVAVQISKRRSTMNGSEAPAKIHATVTPDIDPTLLGMVAQVRDAQRAAIPATTVEVLRPDGSVEEVVEEDDEGYVDVDFADDVPESEL